MTVLLASHPRLRQRATFALAAFVAATFVALLAPVAHGRTVEQVCSVQGTKRIVLDDRSGPGRGASLPDHAAHCPLCMPVGAPPAERVWDFTPVLVRSSGSVGIPTRRVVSLVGAPFPARGPPPVS